MARVIKLIWRLDYQVSYAYLDKRGTAFQLLMETVKDFWQSGGEGTVQASFAAQHSETAGFRNLSLEPTCMNGTIEWSAGADVSRALQDEAFRGTDRIVKELLRLCVLESWSASPGRRRCACGDPPRRCRGCERGPRDQARGCRFRCRRAVDPVSGPVLSPEPHTRRRP